MNLKFIRLTALIVLFSGLIIMLISCEYQPTGTNFRNIDSNYSGAINTFELPEDGDTILIESDKTYKMNYKLGGDLSKFNQAIFFRDTTEITKTSNPEGTISLKIFTEQLYTYYTLTMFVVSHSGTGSLADISNMEGTLQKKSWVLVVYNRKEFESEPLKSIEYNGSLLVKWNMYDFPEFYCYIITKRVGDITQFSDTIYRGDYSQFNDSTYVGEEAVYSVVCTYRKDGFTTTFGYPAFRKSKEIPSVSVKKKSDKSFELSWGKSKYFSNIKGYLFHNNKIPSKVFIDNPDLLTTTINNFPINTNDSLRFFPVPKYYNFANSDTNSKERYINNIPIVSGEISFKYDQIHATSDNNIVFSQSSTLNKYSISEGKIVKQINFANSEVFFSPKGKVVISNTGSNIHYILNENYDNKLSISDQEVIGSKSDYGFGDVAVSDNGILVAYIDYYIYIVDLNTKTKIMSFVESSKGLAISSNGDYLAVMTQINGKLLTKVFSLSSGSPVLISNKFNGYAITFDPDNNSRLYYHDVDNQKTCYYDCITNEITTISNSNSYLHWQIDFVERHVIVSKVTGEYEIRNLDNFALIYDYKSTNGWGFINSRTIYFSRGLKCSY